VINLRYHVVSLVAVFLAIGVGVVMGSTVIDRVTVDALNRRVNQVEASVRNTEAANHRLSGQLDTMRTYADQSRDQLVRGHLRNVPVLVMAVAGIDRKAVDELRQALLASDASMAGTLWLTGKMKLLNDADTKALADAVGQPADRPDVARTAALTRLAGALERGGSDNPITSLTTAGFLTYDAPPSQAGSTTSLLTGLPTGGVRVVLVSGAGADVGDDQVAVPLVRAFDQAGQGGQGPALGPRLVAAEAGQDTPGGRGVFVGLLRNDSALGAHVSTVDDLDSPMGQAAAVLALDDLGIGRTGHFGVGPGAQRLLPSTGT
jgi:hypothetical protein